MNEKIPKPQLIAFEVTRKCRFACKHCRANATFEPDNELTTAQCKKILESIARFHKCVVILTGGEPMERSDIYKIIEHGRKLGLRMVMATCGYLIDDNSMEKLKKAGIMALSFSLDGASAQTHDEFRQSEGAFDSAIKAAQTAKKAKMRFQINTTISRFNFNEVHAIAKLAEKLGAYCFNPFIMVPTGRAEEISNTVIDPVEYEILLNELLKIKLNSKINVRVTCGPAFARVCLQAKKRKLVGKVNGCMGGKGFGFISYKGDIQTCGFLEISAGNLLENRYNFGKIWEKSKFLNQIRNIANYTGTCGDCDYAGICGGCRARAYTMTGDFLGSDPVCDFRKAKTK